MTTVRRGRSARVGPRVAAGAACAPGAFRGAICGAFVVLAASVSGCGDRTTVSASDAGASDAAFTPATGAIGASGNGASGNGASGNGANGAIVAGADAAAASPRTRVLRAARALAPRTGTVTAPAYLVIEGDHIVSLTSQPPGGGGDGGGDGGGGGGGDAGAAGDAGTGAGVTDLGDVTILPGLVDAHTHLLHHELADESSMVGEVAMMTEADRALRGVTFAKEMLRAGFTTVRDLGNSGRGGDVSLKRAIRKGWVEGPTMLVSTRALAPPGGQFPHLNPASAALIEQEYAVVRSPDEARAAVTQAFYEGADCIKVIVDHGAGRTLAEAELRAIVETAHRAEKKVAAHTLSEKAAEIAVAAGVDSIEHGYKITDATLAEMAKKKIALVPTDYPLDYYTAFAPKDGNRQAALDAFKKLRETSTDRLRRARKAKVVIAAGSDAYMATELGDRGKESALIFRAYAESGMTPLEVVQSATMHGSDVLGLGPKAATFEAGAPADVIAVSGDASREAGALEHVVVVIKAGRIVRGAPTAPPPPRD